jgi:hypothetical protein
MSTEIINFKEIEILQFHQQQLYNFIYIWRFRFKVLMINKLYDERRKITRKLGALFLQKFN